LLLTAFIISVKDLQALSPDDVANQSSAEKYLKSVTGMVPESSLTGTAFSPQIVWMGEKILMPALGFTAQLTDELSAYVSAGTVLLSSRAHYASNYGLNYVKAMTNFKGYWNLGVSVVHADHPSWKNRINSLTAGVLRPFNRTEIGFNLSVNYEKGTVRNSLGKFDAEDYYFTPVFIFSMEEWYVKIRLNSQTAGLLLSRRIEL